MKVRRGNANMKANGEEASSLIVGITPDMRKHMGIKEGDEVMWRLNDGNRWELIRIG